MVRLPNSPLWAYCHIPLREYTDCQTGTQCLGGVQTAVTADSVNLYGLLFFSAYYGVFDTSVPQFGFADIVVPP